MKAIYNNILHNVSRDKRQLAVLIDPDKMKLEQLKMFMQKLNKSITTHIFVGGSIVDDDSTEILVKHIKQLTQLPVVLFPGDVTQITDEADALLFLSLISGDNPDYLIGKHIQAVSKIKRSNLEVIPTGYILIENGKPTSVERVTQTRPISRTHVRQVIDTAKAGELLGMQLIYLEAGSGALHPVPTEMINLVKQELSIPVIVGGGIRSKVQLQQAYAAGADVVVIGTAFEENDSFFDDLKR
ncbi:geranylgeranylglyceryl/heptaprenylglyceryl phosphate synthase [uncultured Psychroserpens sp.]|uniref:geranylgeranylglyceryl/heptaprenylglyceryl phosphate synthase n=1 Tax=uncultured Psychroserpens sp. TaxID=255436 RepID=UPI0026231373|nr:geranylgeranylglyceryl/heptaprenylglyceryl phosphate synthase [uncultured Psychroserpens sp.]